MPFYHCSVDDLKKGDIIYPGNWRKSLIAIGPHHESWGREIILESIRLQYFSHKPSRLYATFVRDNLDTIKFYKTIQMPNGNIYEVEYTDTNAIVHKGDFNAVQPIPTVPGDMITIALGYWEYRYTTQVADWEHVECSEFVSATPIRIVRVVE